MRSKLNSCCFVMFFSLITCTKGRSLAMGVMFEASNARLDGCQRPRSSSSTVRL